MKKLTLLLAFLLCAVMSFAQVPTASHVVVVMLENTPYSAVTSTSMPWLTYTTPRSGGKALAYYATTHPSIGNYFSLTTGQILTNSDGYTGTVTADNLVRHFLLDGITWKSYAESLPSVGYIGGDSGSYMKHHNPFAYFSDVRNSTVQRNNLVPFTQFAIDRSNGALPRFSFVVPNSKDDAHNCPTSSSCTLTQKLQHADAWMKTNIAPLLATPDFQPGGSGLLIIVFDESSSSDTAYGGGHVWMTMMGPQVLLNVKSATHFNHYGMLRTIMEALGETSFPAKAATATDLATMF